MKELKLRAFDYAVVTHTVATKFRCDTDHILKTKGMESFWLLLSSPDLTFKNA